MCVIWCGVFSPISYATETNNITGAFSYDTVYVTNPTTLQDEWVSGGYNTTSFNSGDSISFSSQLTYSSTVYPVLVFTMPFSCPAGNSFGFTITGVDVCIGVYNSSYATHYNDYHMSKSDVMFTIQRSPTTASIFVLVFLFLEQINFLDRKINATEASKKTTI